MEIFRLSFTEWTWGSSVRRNRANKYASDTEWITNVTTPISLLLFCLEGRIHRVLPGDRQAWVLLWEVSPWTGLKTLLGSERSFPKPRETERMHRGVLVAIFQDNSKSSQKETVSDFEQHQQSEGALYLWVLRPYHRISGEHRRGLPSVTDQDS